MQTGLRASELTGLYLCRSAPRAGCTRQLSGEGVQAADYTPHEAGSRRPADMAQGTCRHTRRTGLSYTDRPIPQPGSAVTVGSASSLPVSLCGSRTSGTSAKISFTSSSEQLPLWCAVEAFCFAQRN